MAGPLLTLVLAAAVSPPAAVDGRLQVTLVAAEPDIVTPIGLAVDARGRLYAVESHTHFPPDGYKGPGHDLIKVFADADGDGRYEKRWTFAEGLRKTMQIAFAPDGRLYAAQRDRVIAFEDTDGDGRADRQSVILR